MAINFSPALVPALASEFFNTTFDSVAIFDQNFNQVFASARPVKARVKETSKFMSHPVENGDTITDHKIILPIEIELSLILLSSDFKNVYAQLKNAFIKSSILTVQTRTASYNNMVIEAEPHDEDPDTFDVIPMALKLKEVQFVTAQYALLPPSSVADPAHSSTAQIGQQQGQPPSAAQQVLAGATYDRNLTGVTGF